MTSAEIAATATAAAIATTATTVATTTATAVTTTVATTVTAAVTALFATEATTVATVFATGLFAAGGWYKDGLGRDTEQGRELALQRSPETNRCLHGDDDGFNLDTRAIFATRATFAFGAGFATRTVALRDAGLAAFFGETFRTRLTRFATRTTFAFGAGFTTRTVFAGRSGGLGAVTREVLGQLRRIFDDADGRAGSLTVGGGGSGATGRTTTTELLRGRDGAGLGGGFGRGPDHGERREFRVGGLQLGFVEAGCGGADFIGACVRGGLVGGDVLLALGFFLAHVAYVGAAFVVADRMMRPFRCGAATRFVGPLVTEDEPPWGAEMTRERLPEPL